MRRIIRWKILDVISPSSLGFSLLSLEEIDCRVAGEIMKPSMVDRAHPVVSCLRDVEGVRG